MRLRRKHRTTVRIRQLASHLSRTAACASGLAIFSIISLGLLTEPSAAQQTRTYNPPVHIQPGQQTAAQRYSGIVEPDAQNSEYSIVGSVQQPVGRQLAGGSQPGHRAPQLQNRIAQALSSIAGRGNTQQTAQAIPTNPANHRNQPAPTMGTRRANLSAPQNYRPSAPIGTGVRGYNANRASRQYARNQQTDTHNSFHRSVDNSRQRELNLQRQFPVQPIHSAEQLPQQFDTAQNIATSPSYYDRPDIQVTSAQQFDDEIYIEDEPDFHVAQTPAQLPGLQDYQTQTEPVSVLNTSPDFSDNGYSQPYQDPQPTDFDAELQPGIPVQENDLRLDEPVQLNQAMSRRQDDDNDRLENPFERPCDEVRDDLLNRSIKDIALDISPLRSPNATEYRPQHRIWTDQFGREVATGIITGVRRGYVLVDNNGTLQRIPYGNLSDPDLDVVARFWQIPKECRVSQDVFMGRSWAPQTITWKASNLCHKPLYFEDIQLERYGHSHGPFAQPVHSTIHFFSNLILLPYNTGINPPNECRYALGYYRPGNCAPWLKDPFPISLAGTQRQISAMTGAGFLIIP